MTFEGAVDNPSESPRSTNRPSCWAEASSSREKRFRCRAIRLRSAEAITPLGGEIQG
ncbi:hypothetical protein [Cyanobium sp. Morenito 9A2]|uniref:hypothetical protein n=1 Tax=Cyanobium sp. Morenito 9A2 TaxID=2823718 RepID=UPI0020CD8E5F|nr:hypothetical protein [Cyanobium sp. Morenito 9A2]